MGFVRLIRGAILEVHNSAECIAVASRGKVLAYVRLDQSRNDSLEGAYLLLGLLLLRGCRACFPLEGEDVNKG